MKWVWAEYEKFSESWTGVAGDGLEPTGSVGDCEVLEGRGVWEGSFALVPRPVVDLARLNKFMSGV